MTDTVAQQLKQLRGQPLTAEQVEAIRQDPLQYMPYFTEWGRKAWVTMTHRMLHDKVGVDWFAGKRVLDLGARYGKMSTLFGLLGADVVGLDYNAQYLSRAVAEAELFGVSDRIEFVTSDATEYLETSGEKFDLVFLKSVLTVIPTPLDEIVPTIARSLAPEGRMVAVENGKGHPLFHMLRRFDLRKNSRPQQWTYFDDALLQMVSSYFETFDVQYLPMPPVYGMVAGGCSDKARNA